MIDLFFFSGRRLTHTQQGERRRGIDVKICRNFLPQNRFNVAIQFGAWSQLRENCLPAFLLLQRPIIVRCVKQGKIVEIFLGKWKLRNLLAGRVREVGGRLESGDNFFGTADLVFRSEDFSPLPSARLLLSGRP